MTTATTTPMTNPLSNPLRLLFTGGTGAISTACVREALAQGHEVTVLNRGRSTTRPVPDGARVIHADVRDVAATRSALAGQHFDSVSSFVSFTPDHVRADLEIFEELTDQYVFISSASAYQKPPARLPVTESTPLRNPWWSYSRDKIACEQMLVEDYRERGLPVTIVRPSHTYDETMVPTLGGWTDVLRMRAGDEVVVHGDGSSLWTITHVRDFAVGYVGLLGRPDVLGEAFHITGDETPTWDAIYRALAAAAGVSDPRLVHITSDVISSVDPDTGAGLLGDKAHSMVFDTTKIRRAVPAFEQRTLFAAGAREIVAWHDADPARAQRDASVDALYDRLLASYRPGSDLAG